MILFKKRIIQLFLLFIALFIYGCGVSNFYVLSTASEPRKISNHLKGAIGVEKVTLPEYLFKHEVAIAKSDSEVSFISSAAWAEDLDTGLTRRLISFLQKKFNQPNVHAYPWGVDKQPKYKIKVDVTRFIAQGDHVYLDATWDIEDLHKNRHRSQLFSTKIETSSDTSAIVSAMNSAFGELEVAIANGLQ
ncbi:MAG: Unknown protein [uncultured Sulfurovum sp.]|uniref:ABC-type transport auxiliary lipoprotein component domain-containing protein n=1 Tax=uncultured Sulfurovum sp. TaxID=269237 RepID=A0A6S6S772_9BACT|nr:MAG: Unknown protein [uncultured Sulfurovum sp.]